MTFREYVLLVLVTAPVVGVLVAVGVSAWLALPIGWLVGFAVMTAVARRGGRSTYEASSAVPS